MKKTVVIDFDVIGYRECLKEMRNEAKQNYEKLQGSLQGIAYETGYRMLDLCLERLEDYVKIKEIG